MSTITTILRELAEKDPELPAVTCAGDSVTRGELHERGRRLAHTYREHGVTTADTVAIALPNGIEFFVATLACWMLGAVPLPLSHRFPAAERRAVVDLADARIVVGAAKGEHPGRTCLPLGFVPPPTTARFDEDLVSPSWQITTSGGSTGQPKLIVSSFSSQGAAQLLTGMATPMGMPTGGVVLAPTPMYHGAGFQFAWSGLLIGAHVVVLPKFNATAALETITQFRVQWMFLVPTMMSRMLHARDAALERFDLSSLTMVWHGAGPCPPWVKDAWIELVGPDRLMELYGAGEAPVGAAISGTEWLAHRGSVGKPVGGDVRILDPEGTELPSGEVGEIYLRPVAGAPEKAKVLGAEIRRRQDWMSVGDLGRLDDDGYLYISDRRVDMIVSGGANVYPAEVEAALIEHPRVASAIVVGLPDDDLGQRVHALVETDGDVTADEVLQFLGERLVRYKIPRTIRFVDEPLRDDADKARRTAIRDREITLLGLENLQEGAPGPVWRVEEPVNRTHFARYAGSSGSFHPIHHDDAYAQAAGYPAVFGPGMFTAGVLSHYLTDWLGRPNIRRFGVRFRRQVFPGDTLTCSGAVTRRHGQLVEVTLQVTNQHDQVLVSGTATADLPTTKGKTR
ncbi:bile acid-coenzyme A ligase [Kibdelosporangium banguiense]|uniref:Bile acid-coenzyme A ligase n=1 Tax=Kibdelosporangium banguiense TaxID=1365924 RepID=A0ABS4TUF9_9PSEU|nr:AMP-binding protein [Kibdelosporangium banguiense]MBP2328057.1 bile acid-coenzyme A ligase [Kibdelosporangium banguiense]